MTTMKWWGWGPEGVEFTHDDKPDLAPFIEQVLGLKVGAPTAPPPRFDELDVPDSRLPDGLRRALEEALTPAFVSSIPRTGSCTGAEVPARPLRQRRGDLGRVLDAVLRPADEDRGRRAPPGRPQLRCRRDPVRRWLVDLRFAGGPTPVRRDRSCRSISPAWTACSRSTPPRALARVQAGVFGPALEQQLGAAGYTLGHFPDSFPHSTLGGWIATRSSGMQSDRYGDIADLAKGLRVVTPTGTLVVAPAPGHLDRPERARDGARQRGTPGDHHRGDRPGAPDPGTAHDPRLPVPDLRRRPGRDARHRRARMPGLGHPRLGRQRDPVLVRARARTPRRWTACSRGRCVSSCAAAAASTSTRCPSRSSATRAASARSRPGARTVGRMVRPTAGCASGQARARSTTRRSSTLRTFATSCSTAESPPTSPRRRRRGAGEPRLRRRPHRRTRRARVRGARGPGRTSCATCPTATTPAPASTSPSRSTTRPSTTWSSYDRVKQAIQQGFVDNGATLSHHHAVGTEHAQWLEQDISAPGVAMLTALFDGTDPGAISIPARSSDAMPGTAASHSRLPTEIRSRWPVRRARRSPDRAAASEPDPG